MLYVTALIVAILQVALGAHFALWGGLAFYLPALILLSSCYRMWRTWFIWLISLILTGFYLPVPPQYIVLLVVLSMVSYLVFTRWIDEENSFLGALSASGIIALYILAITYGSVHSISISYVGSLIVTLPIVVLWYVILYKPRGRITIHG